MGEGSTGPLHGLLVADFSRVLAGPYATMLLADLGADVIKVEGPGGDDTRSWAPPVRDGVATYYLGVNRNKRSIVLDLTDPGDLRLARRLAERADVMIQNFRPGALRRFGLDHAGVAAANPGLVYASISGFGAAAGAHLPGYDLAAQAASGLMSLTGEPDGPPYKAGVAVLDVIAGLHAAVGILAALRHRERTGLGQHVEVNLLSSALSGLVNHASAYLAAGVVPGRTGNAHPSIFPYEPLPTADGELVVIAGNDGQFRTLCRVLGRPELADDPRFRRNQDRTVNRAVLRPLLVERLARRGTDEWFRELRAAGVPCSPINGLDGGMALARELGLDPVVEVGGAPPDRLLGDAAPARPASARPGRARRAAARLAGGLTRAPDRHRPAGVTRSTARPPGRRRANPGRAARRHPAGGPLGRSAAWSAVAGAAGRSAVGSACVRWACPPRPWRRTMTSPAPRIRTAGPDDVDVLVDLVESAYRGQRSRAGWTHEADLLGGQRTDPAMVAAAVSRPDGVVLVAEEGAAMVACCQLERHDDHVYFGMFAVSPGRQGGGLGRELLAEAERYAREQWHAGELRMTVIIQREDLIAWYERRGYQRTGELSPFPYGDERFGVPLRPDLAFETLRKKLG